MKLKIAVLIAAATVILLSMPERAAAAWCKCCYPLCPGLCTLCEAGFVVCGQCQTCAGSGCVIAGPAENSTRSGTFGVSVGIDVGVDQRGAFVSKVLPASPAFEAGIREGDRILQIDERDTEGMSYREASRLLEAAKAEPVSVLTLSAKGQRRQVLHGESMQLLSERIRRQRHVVAEERFRKSGQP